MLRKQSIDYPLLIIALLLTAFGVAMVFSAGQSDVPTAIEGVWKKQLLFFGAALIACWVVTRGSVRLFEWSAWPAYAICCALLLYTKFFGTGAGTAASSHSWISIGGRRIGQPAEPAKIATVLMMARVLASQRSSFKSLFEMWRPLLVIGIPWVLVMLQPDLGTALGFIGICFAMLFWAGTPWPLLLMLASPGISLVLAFSTGIWGAWFCALIALVVWYRVWLWEGVLLVLTNAVVGIAAPIVWDKLSPNSKHRIMVFYDNSSVDASSFAYHSNQSQIAIGSGGLFGKGFTLGTQKSLGFLPERHTDFIFSVVGEELGFIGVCVALALFLALFFRCIRVSTRANDAFPSLAACGLAALWLLHVVINIGMTLNLMPVTGIPLPFFSYGGSFLLVCWTAVGILLRISGEGRGKADEVSL